MYIFSTEPILLSQREGNRIRPSVLFAFVRVLSVSMLICVTNCVYICVYVCHTCLLVHVPTGNTCPAPLVVAPGGTELQQPHLYQAARSVSPLITTKLPRYPYRKQQKEVQIHALQSKQWPLWFTQFLQFWQGHQEIKGRWQGSLFLPCENRSQKLALTLTRRQFKCLRHLQIPMCFQYANLTTYLSRKRGNHHLLVGG